MFSFANPEYLYLLLLLPVVVLLYMLARMARKKKLQRYGQLAILAEQMPEVSKYKPGIKLVLELIVLALIVVILARPRAGAKETTTKVNGIEVMVAVDVSNSMLASATDDQNGTSRMQQAKMILERVIDKLRNDKVGLIVFAGNAYTQMPITSDVVSAKMFLNDINTSMVPTQGTAIGAAIKMAMNSFTPNQKSQKALIIITDGENHEDDAVEMAKEARKKGIQVNVMGVGTVKGGLIPIGNGEYLKDDQGNVVNTCLNEQMAQDIAKAGGGVYVSGNSGDALSTLNSQLEKLSKTDMETRSYTKHDEQFPVFAWLALLFMLIYMSVIDGKNSWLKKYSFFTKDDKNGKNK